MALPAPACPEADPGHYRRKLEWEGPHRPDRGHFRQKLASGPGVRRRRHQPRTPLSSMSQTKTIPVAVAKVTKCTLWLLRIHLRVAEVTNCTFLDRSVRTGEGLLRQNPRIRIAASPCWPLTRGSGGKPRASGASSYVAFATYRRRPGWVHRSKRDAAFLPMPGVRRRAAAPFGNTPLLLIRQRWHRSRGSRALTQKVDNENRP